MANLQAKHVPDTLHQRLRRYAQGHKCTLSDFVLSAIEHELARREWHDRLAERPGTDLGDSAASLLAEERQERRHVAAARLYDASLLTSDGPLARAPGLGIVVQNIRMG